MKTFEIVTIFPKIFESYFGESIIERAKGSGLISINAHDLRRWSLDKHRKVDDTPYGGGAGMVMNVQPIYDAVNEIKSGSNSRVILFSAKGKRYTQKDARRLLKYDQLILICGRYEGVDERVAKHIADEELSIGEYVLTGGEIPAMVLVDSISRLVPGVLGNVDSLKNESFNIIENCKLNPPAGGENSTLEYPQYTKPDDFQGWSVPKVLLSGNHEKIEEWRAKNSKISN